MLAHFSVIDVLALNKYLQDVGQLADASYTVSLGTQVAIHTTAGGINAAITGGDVGLGIATGGISAGMGSYFRDFAPYGSEVAGHAIIGGITGGTVHAIYGGSFSTGFGQGAVTSVFELWYNERLHPGDSFARDMGFTSTITGYIVIDSLVTGFENAIMAYGAARYLPSLAGSANTGINAYNNFAYKLEKKALTIDKNIKKIEGFWYPED